MTMILYVVYKFGNIPFRHPGDYVVTNCNFWDNKQILASPAKYQRKYWTDLDENFQVW